MQRAVLGAWGFVLRLLQIRGQQMAGLFTLTIIGLSVFATIKRTDIPAGVQSVYMTFVGGFVIGKGVKTITNKGKPEE